MNTTAITPTPATTHTKTPLVILRKDNYGTPVYYPVCEASHALAEIAGTKTLTQQVLRTLTTRLGYRVQITHPVKQITADLFT
jgi:hypothetical protein